MATATSPDGPGSATPFACAANDTMQSDARSRVQKPMTKPDALSRSTRLRSGRPRDAPRAHRQRGRDDCHGEKPRIGGEMRLHEEPRDMRHRDQGEYRASGDDVGTHNEAITIHESCSHGNGCLRQGTGACSRAFGTVVPRGCACRRTRRRALPAHACHTSLVVGHARQ